MIRPGDEVYLINRGMYDEHTVKAWTKITGFVRDDDGRYERFDETVYNTVFEMAIFALGALALFAAVLSA